MVRASLVHAVAALMTVSVAGCSLAAGLGDPRTLEQQHEDAGDDGSSGDDGGIGDASSPSLQAVAIAVGGTHACATVQGRLPGDPVNGTVRCWGSNGSGELAADPASVSLSSVPLAVAGGTTPVADIASVTLSDGYSCAITVDGYVFCWGAVPSELDAGVHREQESPAYEPSIVDLRASALTGVTAAAAGPSGGAVTSGTALVCWGSSMYEQPDAGSSGFSDGGVAVGDIFSTAAVGRAHTCAIAVREGVQDVECWGDNTYGQTGASVLDWPGTVPVPTPVGLSTLGVEITGVAAGGDTSCAVTADGAAYCWGRNDLGQLGNPAVVGDTNVPTQVQLSSAGNDIQVVELAMGDDHACASTAGNSVRCWGDNTFGQLGQGSNPPSSAAPVVVQRIYQGGPSGLPNVQHVAAGGQTTCVVRFGDPLVSCWGANNYGQAGQSPGPTTSIIPYATPMSW
jgi:alpha-tubulin suppressor-like RCC1 family protein